MKFSRRADYFLLAVIVILTVAGLVILASASSELGKIRYNDSYYYLKHQLISGLLPGLLGFVLALMIPYSRYKKLSLFFLIANIVLLILIFTPLGVAAGGATRWLRLGPITFQPSEFLKLTFIVYIAAWLTNNKIDRIKDFARGLLPFLIVSGIIGALLVAQPATSTVAILLFAGLAIYFVSGVSMKHIAAIAAIGILAFGILIWSTPYRMKRIISFFNQSSDIRGSGYQLNQAQITIGSGKLFGVGYGQSTSKVNYLPAPLDDSIFAIAAQELGFIGASSLAILFATLVFRLLWLAMRVRDKFGHLMLVGFASVIALQSFVNMASISGLIPLTGVPLPFVSYGGTALVVFLTMSGIAVNVSKSA